MGFCPAHFLLQLEDDVAETLANTLAEPITPRQLRLLRDLQEANFCRAVDRDGLPHDPRICGPILSLLAQRVAKGMQEKPLTEVQARWIANLRAAQRTLPQQWAKQIARVMTTTPVNTLSISTILAALEEEEDARVGDP